MVRIDDNGDRDADYSLLDLDPVTGRFEVVSHYYGANRWQLKWNVLKIINVSPYDAFRSLVSVPNKRELNFPTSHWKFHDNIFRYSLAWIERRPSTWCSWMRFPWKRSQMPYKWWEMLVCSQNKVNSPIINPYRNNYLVHSTVARTFHSNFIFDLFFLFQVRLMFTGWWSNCFYVVSFKFNYKASETEQRKRSVLACQARRSFDRSWETFWFQSWPSKTQLWSNW